MSNPVRFSIHDQTLWLSRERCLFWEEQQALVLSDLHLGKSGHFRKNGIAVPQAVFKEDLQRLFAQIQFFKPRQLVIVGDLFHSHTNLEHDLFLKWRKDIPHLHIHLVQGNHDILETAFYVQAGITVHNETAGPFNLGNFSFMHDLGNQHKPGPQLQISNYLFTGHIHPGIRISGLGKQSLRFPCFYFGKEYAVLPAFGGFTGTYLVEPKKGEHVFAILPAENGGSHSTGLMKIQ